MIQQTCLPNHQGDWLIMLLATHLHFKSLFMNAYLSPTDVMNLSTAI